MEPLWKLLYLLEPAPVTLIVTAVAVTFGSAMRALNYGKEMERNHDLSEASITLDRSQALMIPVMSSCSLLLMFYLFSSMSQLLTAFTAVASVSSLFFCLSPYMASLKNKFGLVDPYVSRCCSKSFTRIQGLLLLACFGLHYKKITLRRQEQRRRKNCSVGKDTQPRRKNMSVAV